MGFFKHGRIIELLLLCVEINISLRVYTNLSAAVPDELGLVIIYRKLKNFYTK
jgi:hypothetical protein